MKLFIPLCILITAVFGVIFFYVPIEKTQGIVQKIFYIHVSSALTMYVGFFIAFIYSIMYLAKRKPRYYWISKSAIEVGYLFCCIVLVTGPAWAKPIWGSYWTWEPRLTTTFILWLMYTGYLFFQGYLLEERKKGEIASSIIAIITFLNVPLIHFSVKIWRGIHPTVIKTKDGLPPSMTLTLVLTLIMMLCIFSFFYKHRYYLEKIHQQALALGDK